MKKIKKFKVNIRKIEVIRNLKTILNLKELTQELEATIEKEIERSYSYIYPESIFDTFQTSFLKEKFGLEFDPKQNIVAGSLFIITIGEKIEDEIYAAKNKGENILSQIIHCIGLESCNSGINFVNRIIKEEADKEDCEITNIEKIYNKNIELVKKIISNLSGEKINVTIDNNSNIHPIYTTIGLIKWQPKRKRK